MSSVSNPFLRVPSYIRFPLLFGAMALTGYWAWSYSGPYRWIAEFQLEASGSYSVTLNVALSFLLLCLPVMALLFGLSFLFREDSPGNPPLDAEAWIRRNYLFLLGGLLLVAGLVIWIYSLGFGPLTPVSLAELARGEPPSRYVTVRGVPEVEHGISIREDSVTKVYFPLRAEDGARGPVHVFVSMYEARAETDLAEGEYTGLLWRDNLPGLAISAYDKEGIERAASYWLLAHGEDPELFRVLGLSCGAVGAVIVALTALVRRLRRA